MIKGADILKVIEKAESDAIQIDNAFIGIAIPSEPMECAKRATMLISLRERLEQYIRGLPLVVKKKQPKAIAAAKAAAERINALIAEV